MRMNYAEIKHSDIANGEGVRTTLFVSGCRRHCPHCFNESAWNFAAGEPFTDEVAQAVADSIAPAYVDGITLLGGEPMEPENQEGLVGFLEDLRYRYPRGGGKTVWCYTGDTLDELMPGGPHRTDVTDRLLDCIDILVDGAFVQELHDITLRFRGSSNQRVIDLNASRDRASREGVSLAEAVCLWEDDPVFSTHSM